MENLKIIEINFYFNYSCFVKRRICENPSKIVFLNSFFPETENSEKSCGFGWLVGFLVGWLWVFFNNTEVTATVFPFQTVTMEIEPERQAAESLLTAIA